MKFSQSTYDFLQKLVRVGLPGLATLYLGFADLWNLPNAIEVAGSLTLLAVFLGSLLTKSSADFKRTNEPAAGFVQQTGVDPDTGIPSLALTLSKLPQELLDKKTITLKVDNPSPPPVV